MGNRTDVTGRSRLDVVGLDTEAIAEILRDFGVVVAYQFGSRALGRAGPESDLDIAVLTETRPSLLDRQRLADRIRIATAVPDVDVVVLTDAPLELRGRVVQEGRLIYSVDEARRVSFEGRTRSEYFDFLPTLQQHTRRFLRRVAERGL
ncbi:MAG: type VII toxin-antitoxin system MntA family adenylyltransferase antitoxin [Actinomycetota bacterium]